jgi:hypothetical protein
MPAADSLARARAMVDRRDFPAAQQVLRDLLSRAQADPARADADQGDAAVLYAAVLLQLGEPHAARGWADHGHTVSAMSHGAADRRTLHALGVLAISQHRSGALGRAARHYAQLIALLSAVEGPDSDRVLAARADAATVDHARGLCTAARARLEEVIDAHQLRHGPTHPLGIRMVARLAGMWRDCGHFDTAHELLARARSYAESTPHEDDTHRLLATAGRAPANPEHHCGVETVEPTDSSATNVFPLVIPGPADLIPANGAFTEIDVRPEDPHRARAPQSPPQRAAQPFPPAIPPAQPFPPAIPPAPTHPAASAPVPARPGSQPWRPAPAADPLPSTPEPGSVPPLDWPEDEIFDRAPADAPPGAGRTVPTAHSLPGLGGEPELHRPARPGVTTLAPIGRPHPGAVRPQPAAPGEQLRIPVTGRSNQAKAGRSTAVVAVAACAAIAALAALGAAVLLARRADQPATAAQPTGSAAGQSPASTPTPAAQEPVRNLALTDQGGDVLVTWSYPAAAQGPLVVSVADLGQPMRPLQSLPAGTERYTVRGLDKGKNYCVTVTMAYGADNMVMATPVCTSRE